MPGKHCASVVALNLNDRVDWLMLEWGDRWVETKECIRLGWGGLSQCLKIWFHHKCKQNINHPVFGLTLFLLIGTLAQIEAFLPPLKPPKKRSFAKGKPD